MPVPTLPGSLRRVRPVPLAEMSEDEIVDMDSILRELVRSAVQEQGHSHRHRHHHDDNEEERTEPAYPEEPRFKVIGAKLDKFNPNTDYTVQYDLDMASSDLGWFISSSSQLFTHRFFNSFWKQGYPTDNNSLATAECHLQAIEPHGCFCAKHVKYFGQRLVLLLCHTCDAGAYTQKKEERG
ncbi:hypothetical protein NDA16_002517 [Ustilago loliicola]|nr:hypothetical protein NDA16_002517 [Ustilago loliicola]